MDMETGFLFLALSAGLAWAVLAYWQVKLIKRILIVSRDQHEIPDSACHALWRKRNISASIFLAALTAIGVLMAFTVLNGT